VVYGANVTALASWEKSVHRGQVNLDELRREPQGDVVLGLVAGLARLHHAATPDFDRTVRMDFRSKFLEASI
jgi:hypothetical protein